MSRNTVLTTLLAIGLALAGRAALGAGQQALLAELRRSGLRIIHETWRNGNWELVIRNADGSKPVNLTRTPHVDELYPKASPDGRHVAFVAMDGAGRRRARSVYYMKIDGGDRVLAAPHGRQPFWAPDGKSIAFTMGTKPTAAEGGYDSNGLYFYDIETRALTEAPRTDIKGLLAPCFSPDGQWVVASVIEGMGFQHAIAAFPLRGDGIVPLARGSTADGSGTSISAGPTSAPTASASRGARTTWTTASASAGGACTSKSPTSTSTPPTPASRATPIP